MILASGRNLLENSFNLNFQSKKAHCAPRAKKNKLEISSTQSPYFKKKIQRFFIAVNTALYHIAYT